MRLVSHSMVLRDNMPFIVRSRGYYPALLQTVGALRTSESQASRSCEGYDLPSSNERFTPKVQKHTSGTILMYVCACLLDGNTELEIGPFKRT